MPSVSESDVRKYPFVYPIYWSRAGLILSSDNCPLKKGHRLQGCGTATAEAALAVIVNSLQVAFLPEILCRGERSVKEVYVEEWGDVKKQVYLTARADLIQKKMMSSLIESMSRLLA